MPITPFHFGPGLLAKAVAPTHFSLTAYCATQVVIDVESGYHLLTNHWPVHRALHTALVGGLVGLVAGVLVGAVGARVAARWSRDARIVADLRLLGALIGGIVGGLSHALLDGVMHTDIRPFVPFSSTNPLLGIVSVSTLHLACLLTGALGAMLWAARGDSGQHLP